MEVSPQNSSNAIYEAIYQTLARMSADQLTPSLTSSSPSLNFLPGMSQETSEAVVAITYHGADTPTPRTLVRSEEGILFKNLDKLNRYVYPPEEVFECPLWYDCDWAGTRRDIYTHCKDTHPQAVFESGVWFACTTVASGKYIVYDKGNIFFFFIEKKLGEPPTFDIQYLTKTTDFVRYAFEFLQRDHISSRVVRRKLGIVKKYSGRIRYRFNSVFDGEYFRFSFKEVPVQELKCRKCDQPMKGRFVGDRAVWYCFQCPLRVNSCSNWFDGCIFVDYPTKVKSHERLFCHFTRRCLFCPNGPDITESSILCHYFEHHKQLTRKSHFTYTMSKSYVTTLINVQQCLLAVECKLKQFKFLRIMIFMEFVSALSRCYKLYVKVRDSKTDIEKIYPTRLIHFTPDNYGADWYLKIDIPKEFPNWSGMFIIDVSIKRKMLAL